jgi:hypothetical protein
MFTIELLCVESINCVVLITTVAEFKVGGLALALLSFRPVSTQSYLDQILGLKSDKPPQRNDCIINL